VKRSALALFLAILTHVAGSLPARADLPPVVFSDAFKALCTELRAAADCADCGCDAMTSTSADGIAPGTQPDFAYAVIVRLQSPSDKVTPESTATFKTRFFIAYGSDAGLKNGGLLHSGDATNDAVSFTDIDVKKSFQFSDICLSCDHQNAGLVHLFDVVLKHTRIDERDNYERWETTTDEHMLVACYRRDDNMCFATRLGVTEQTSRQPQAPGDRPKPGKKQSWSRSWKIGGRAKMQLVLGTITGNKAAEIKKSDIGQDPSAFNFTDLPIRESAKPLPR